LTVTLYRDSKKHKFEDKVYLISVEEKPLSIQGKIKVSANVLKKHVLYNVIGTGEQIAFTGGGGGTGCCKAEVDGSLMLVGGTNGRASIRASGRGAALGLSAGGVHPDGAMTVELLNSSACWKADYAIRPGGTRGSLSSPVASSTP